MRIEKSCGAVIFTFKDGQRLYLIEHTASGHTSIPKGHVEGNETHVETALRELKEEANIVLTESDLYDCGMFLYTKYKDLHLYVAETDINLKDLSCSTTFNFEGRTPLEVDDYKLIDDTATQTYYRSLGPLVADCIKRYKERDINKV